ncbi:1-acyl-sn-glycerol-3-phosphate acyltransferase [Pseudoduganella albidiflava]|uniref:Phospholipid/glycerol acyltransferase domain-containing protein n=2 Tax=Pseudoduganella albidiflava TaxID=321983 RepID=A0AA88C594_9BURK|nr:1-acyl-sn-glycerol-3-phosphate acyltransferase [Pseudoduganella albidiflava]GGY60290.1 hypothetical protein GCM10007387_48690 [Pseudoduganella albidiflava]
MDTNSRDTNRGDTNRSDANRGDTNRNDTNRGDTNLGEASHGDTKRSNADSGRSSSSTATSATNSTDTTNNANTTNTSATPDYRLDPARLPTVGQRLALRVLHFFGWQMHFRPLPGPRGIVVVYPHTSNWDFVIGLVAKWAMNLPYRWLAKDSMFRMPVLGSWFRWLGGQPVDRSAPQGMIRAQAERMHAASWYWLVITPEGTRGYRPNWKSGFYHLALEARVPLVLVSLDYPNKVLDFTQHLWLTGDREQDLAAIRAAYAGRMGKHPENAAPIELGERRREPRQEP